ncbi:CBS domain protein [Malaciobacter marinus]|uniref:CBS domain protein n=1 Tax=Malaciobacter marinus TaxID=505249 RepID=A0AB36ZXM2_9BACT|nr:CBS domain-containing protein [Malaciobacter marinus]PPK61449.1 CBS domain protein [Malaciobacter marinus]SKB82094.1 CBS domain-containing protein [Malaciobacter marinus]
MFAIYNNGSVGFRSTADNLYELKNLDAPAEARLKPDDDTLFQDYLDHEKKDKQTEQKNQKAVNAYKKMANLDTSEEVYQVQDIMTKDIIYIDNKASVEQAYEKLKEESVSHIPIVSFGKKIIGIINKKTILNLLIEDIENYQNILNRKLEDLVLKEVITADPTADIRSVCKVMLDFKIDAIPIVNEEDIIVGIVSKTDIIKAVSHLPKLQLWS